MIDADAIRELSLSESIRAANERAADHTTALPNEFQIHDLEKFQPKRRLTYKTDSITARLEAIHRDLERAAWTQ